MEEINPKIIRARYQGRFVPSMVCMEVTKCTLSSPLLGMDFCLLLYAGAGYLPKDSRTVTIATKNRV